MAIALLLKEIEERKAIEAELRRANAELEERYINTECGYHSLNADGVVLTMNDIELFWLGYHREEIVGKMKLTQLLSPECRGDFQKAFEFLLEHGWVRQLQCDMLRKDGSTFPIMVNERVIEDDAGNFLRSCAAIFDLSERRRAETAWHQQIELLEQRVSERTRDLRMTEKILAAEIAARKLAESAAMNLSNRMQDMPCGIVVGDAAMRCRLLQFSRK